MSATLYRKYRPQTFSEVIGQKHVVQTLKNAVKSKRIGQAYLFAGPRGTGKTSIARIFAKTINCTSIKNGEPCLKCPSCLQIKDARALDIIEIDAASNTGVDNIRELRETVKLPPSTLKYKVYIIDEVHMLSGGAFNALLKTLEEPPAHVVFILATTEVHKIPETILSRVQRFDFTRLTIEEVIGRLEELSRLEKVKIEREALEIIASHSEGGMRNAESLLGQIIALEDKRITAKEVEFILGTVSEKELSGFVDSVVSGDIAGVFFKIGALRESGVDFKNFGKSLLNYLRQMLILKINPDFGEKMSYEMTPERIKKIKIQQEGIGVGKILDLIREIQENSEKFKTSHIPQLFLEVSFAKLSADNLIGPASLSNKMLIHPDTSNPTESVREESRNDDPKKSEASSSVNAASKKGENHSKSDKKPGNVSADLDLVLAKWPMIIEALKDYNHSLSSVLKMSSPVFIDKDILVINTKYDFYKEKICDTQNRLTIEDTIDRITGASLKLKPLTEKEISAEYGDIQPKKSLLQEAVDIFGGKIVGE